MKDRVCGILFVIFVIFTISLIETIQIADADTIVVPIEHDTIQAAIDAASDDDIINVQNGIYDEAITLSKKLTINGEGNNTILQKPWILSANSTISNLKSSNFNGNAFTMTTDDTFVFDNITIENVGGNGIFTGDDGTTSSANITVKNSNFKNNGLTSPSNPADLEIFRFDGTMLIKNVSIEKANQNNAGNDNTYGIEFRGDICNGATDSGVVSVTLINVKVSGTPNKDGIVIQCYSDVFNFSFTDVDLSEVTTDTSSFWPTALVVDHTGTTPLDVGNLKTQEIIAVNSGDINATETKFFDSDMNLVTDNFDIEDRVGHALDADGAGLVTWNVNNLYVTEKSGSIQRGVDNIVSGGTVNVKEGLYEIDSTIIIDKPLTLLGPQADIDPRTAASLRTFGDSSEAIIKGPDPVIKNLMNIDSDNVTINGFEITHGGGDLIKSSGDIIKNPVVKYNLIHDSNDPDHLHIPLPFFGDEGIQLKETEDAIIKFNHINNTDGDGINLAFSHNGLIDSNEVHNSNSTNAGIYLYNDAKNSASPTAFTNFINATIQNNLVYDILQNDGIKLGDKGGDDEGIKGGSILNNIIHDTRQDGITVYTSDTLVNNNEIFNSASENGALYVSWNTTNITINDNKIHDNESPDSSITFGIRIGKGAHFPTNVIINENTIRDNESGLFYNFQISEQILDATKNYWGSSKGPTLVNNNSSGNNGNGNNKGDTVSDNVSFDPWYLNSGLTSLSSDKTGKKLKSQGNSVELDSSNNGDVSGQASLPTGVEEIELDNNAVLDVVRNIALPANTTQGEITIGNQTKQLLNFTSGSLVNVDLKQEKSVGDKKVLVNKAVKLKSGNSGKPTIITNADLSSVSVSIPDNTTILASDEWDGTIQPPKLTASSGNAPTGFTVGDTIIDVGSPDIVLLFDNPVDVLLLGVTGNVGYKPAGSTNWIPITEQCGGSFTVPDAPSAFPGECFISNGSDTKIVTYHFTEFGELDSIPPSTESSSAKSSSSGGSGRINVSPQEIAKKSNTSMSRISDWVSSKDYFKIGVRDLISRGYIENINTIPSQSPPDWFYSTGQAWKEGKITNEEYFDAVKYLINHKILK